MEWYKIVTRWFLHEWNRQLVSPVGLQNANWPAALYDGALRPNGQIKFVAAVDRCDHCAGVHVLPGRRGDADLAAGILWTAGRFPVADAVAQCLQAGPGKPAIYKLPGTAEGSGAPLLQLPCLQAGCSGPQGKGQNFHHLPEMQRKVYQKDISRCISRLRQSKSPDLTQM